MKMPTFDDGDENANDIFKTELTSFCTEVPPPKFHREISEYSHRPYGENETEDDKYCRIQKEMIFRALKRVRFIAEYFKRLEDDDKVTDIDCCKLMLYETCC